MKNQVLHPSSDIVFPPRWKIYEKYKHIREKVSCDISVRKSFTYNYLNFKLNIFSFFNHKSCVCLPAQWRTRKRFTDGNSLFFFFLFLTHFLVFFFCHPLVAAENLCVYAVGGKPEDVLQSPFLEQMKCLRKLQRNINYRVMQNTPIIHTAIYHV